MNSKGRNMIFKESATKQKKVSDENSNKANHKKEYVFDNIMKKSNLQINIHENSLYTQKIKPVTSSIIKKTKNKNKTKIKTKTQTQTQKDSLQKYFKNKSHHKSEMQKSLLNYFSSVKGEKLKSSFLDTQNEKKMSENHKTNLSSHNLIFEKDKLLKTIHSIQNLKISLDNNEESHSNSNSENSDNDDGAFIRFDSNSQSVSLMSMKSLRKKKESEEKSLQADSIIINNLSMCPENNSNNISPRPNAFLEKDYYSKKILKTKFSSQMNNRIIEELSPEIFKSKVNIHSKKKIKELSFSDCFKIGQNIKTKYNYHQKKKSECLSSKYYLFNKQLSNDLYFANDHKNKFNKIPLSNEKNKKLKIFFQNFKNKLKQKIEICFYELKELDTIHSLINSQDSRTKLMIKNIPNKFTITQLVDLFNQDFSGMFDFLYLVIDSKTDCNQGYGFINLCRPEYKSQFFKKYHRSKWPGSKSGKVCEISYAKLQTPEKIDELFIEKYFREWNKYWVNPNKILEKFPNQKTNLINLENYRRNSNINTYFMNYQGFYGNNLYPFGY